MTEPESRGPTLPQRRAGHRAAAFSIAVYHRDGSEVAPLERSIVVGRADPSDIVVEDRSLSRQHARFHVEDGVVRVTDLGSTNGTFVAGARIETAELSVGTTVEFGDTRCIVHARGVLSLGIEHVETHERILGDLTRYVGEARHYREHVALMMIKCATTEGESLDVSAWHAKVSGSLRTIDRIGMYSHAIMEVVLVRSDEAQALEHAAMVTEQLTRDGVRVWCSVAVYPTAGTTAQELLQHARHELERAQPGTPRVAASVHTDHPELVVESRAMKALVDQLDRMAKTSMPVLLIGETGTGKELVAHAIHRSSPRANGPLVPLNCGAIPAQLVESTLFGHVRGAFTGASRDSAGVFGAADGGTVLLDEIGELPLPAQTSLLRVLETGRVTRVGADREEAIDVRVIAATHRDLDAMVERDEFREDLLYRINALPLVVPPLRERATDIPVLAERFLDAANLVVGEHRVRGFSPESMASLTRYRWPGNVRELRNIVERACVLADGDLIEPQHLTDRFRARAPVAAQPDGSGSGEATTDLRESLRTFEVALLTRALREAKGDGAHAAQLLNIPYRTLNYKLKNLNIDKTDYE